MAKTEVSYVLLQDEDRRKMVENAIYQLEQKHYEAEINLTILGPSERLAPEGKTAPQKMAEIEEQLALLRSKYQDLLENQT